MTSGESRGGRTTFGAVLRELRETVGLTQEELAERAGMTVHGVSALERGVRTRPYPHTVRSLAAALSLDEMARARLLTALPTSAQKQSRRAGRPEDRPGGAFAPRTRLHGRQSDIAAVTALIRGGDRLVSLTGPGGVGKTRLAAALAERLGPDFVDGAVVVAAAHAADAGEVLGAVAAAVGAPEDQLAEVHQLVHHLADRQTLLVVDNLEQVPDVGPHLAELVSRCAALSVVVTSRTPLRVRDERTFVVEPLPVPAGTETTVAELKRSSSAALFLDRARAVAGHVPVADGDAGDVAELCRRLAGIPLALELVAAHAGTLAPRELLERLTDVLAQEGLADLPPRQRTLRATLDWSRALLTPAQERLLERLCVFRAPFTLEAAEAVAPPSDPRGAGSVDGPPVWATLGRLVDHSLVQVTSSDAGRRYHVLEPVAQHITSALDPTAREDARRAHAAWVLDLTESAAPQYTRENQVQWLERLDAQEADLAAALQWAVEHDPAAAARMGWALWLFWWLRGHLRLGRGAMERVLGEELPPGVRARALLTHAAMTFALGDLEVSGPGWRAAADLARSEGDLPALASGTAGTGLVALVQGDLDAAETAFGAALELARRPETGWVGEYLAGLAEVWLGTVALARQDMTSAHDHLARGLADARRRGDRLTAYVALFNLAQAGLATKDETGAQAALVEAAQLSAETRDGANLAFVLDGAAVLASAGGQFARVPVLVGAADALRESNEGRVYGYYLQDVEQLRTAVDAARETLGQDSFDDLVDHGRSLAFEDAVAAVVQPPDC